MVQVCGHHGASRDARVHDIAIGAAKMKESIFEAFQTAVRAEELGIYGIHIYRRGRKSAELRFRDDARVHLYSGSKKIRIEVT